MLLFNSLISSLYILDFIILLSLDNEVLETSKRRAVLCNILSQIFIVKYCQIPNISNFGDNSLDNIRDKG